MTAERQINTEKQTDTLITIRRSLIGGGVNIAVRKMSQ